ncbi:hypothetical protein [Salinisphaera hydrothermalis]|uniref:hypothetical protein n=1 Tax=Salinisphaera hydrothermalis TaxID=563188 RepID=UPI00334091A4
MTARRAGIAADRWAVGGLIALYLVSRVAAYIAGVRFDLSPMGTSWQILDPVLLQHDLLASLLYMPGQPPLYNLLLGIVVKISAAVGGGDFVTAAIFRVIFALMALGSVLVLYALLRRVGTRVGPAVIVAGLFMCSPALMLYESLPYYTVIVLLLLVVIVWLFDACRRDFSMPRALALFGAMAILIYTRSLFQIEWFVVLVAYAALVLPGHRRAVLVAAALPFLLILTLYAKNVAVIGEFSTSDWMGMSLAKLSTLELDHAERERLVASGRMTPLALDDKAYDIPEAYEGTVVQIPHTGIAVLDNKRKTTGHVNFNYLPYAKISGMARHDALVAIRTHPGVYLHSVGVAWLMFWRPSSDYPFLKANRDAIQPWAWLYAKVIGGQPVYPDNPRFDLKPATIGIFIALVYIVCVLFGLGVLLRCAWRRRVSNLDATLIFIWLNVMYVSVIGNMFEIDENQRFRFALNPLIAILGVVAVQRARSAVRRRREHRLQPS